MFNVPCQEMLQKKYTLSPMHIHTFCCIQSMYLVIMGYHMCIRIKWK